MEEETFEIQLQESEYLLIKAAAEIKGVTIEDFLIDSALEIANIIVE
jgi:uncharacterized protein (DUF1778 family)